MMARFPKKSLLVILLNFCFLASGICAPSVEKPKNLELTDKMRVETRYVIHALESLHYSGKPFSSLSTDEILKSYMTDLDPNHLFFLQPVVNSYIDRFSPTLEAYLQQGNIYPAFVVFKNYKEDVNARIKWVMDRLEKSFSFDQNDEFIPNRRKLDWPQTQEAADDLWEKRIKYEILNELLSDDDNKNAAQTTPQTDDPTQPAAAEKTHEEKMKLAVENVKKRYERLKKANDKIDAADIEEIFLTTITQMYDPHSTFLSAESMEDFSISLHNSLIGIGAMLTDEDGICSIKELIPGGPAAISKQIHMNDKIVGVAQGDAEFVDIIGMKLRDSVNLIRGKKGTTVRLLINPAGETDTAKRKIITLVRDDIKLSANVASAQLFEVPEGDKMIKVGVIDLPTFYGPASEEEKKDVHSTTKDVRELIERLQAMGMQGLVLDLRQNGGGLLNEAVSLTGLFIPIGPVLQVKDSFGRIREYMDSEPTIAWKGPLIVLTSRYSASASEIVVGALKSYRRALIVGDSSTHGKGTVQVILEVEKPMFAKWLSKSEKMGATKITIQKWYLPDGSSTQQKGVASNIVLPSMNEYLPIGESDLPNALPWDAIHPLPWDDLETFSDYIIPVDNIVMDVLNRNSIERQSKLEEFAFLKKNIARFKEKQDKKELSLNFTKRKEMRIEDEEAIKTVKEEIKRLAKNNFIYEDVRLKGYEDAGPNDDHSFMTSSLPKDEDEKLPQFDINLREGLRIMSDWIDYTQAPKAHTQTALEEKEEPATVAAAAPFQSLISKAPVLQEAETQ